MIRKKLPNFEGRDCSFVRRWQQVWPAGERGAGLEHLIEKLQLAGSLRRTRCLENSENRWVQCKDDPILGPSFAFQSP
jgi:hypothetical protein